MEIETTQAAAAAPGKKEGNFRETARFMLILFIAAVILRSFIVAPFSIPSGSMLPRMMIGDYLFVAKWPYGFSRYSLPLGLGGFEGRIFDHRPARGDIVVFHYPGGNGEDFVKRVIGFPGETIQVSGGQVSINGEKVKRTRVSDFLMPVSPNSPCRTVYPAKEKIVTDANGNALCAYPRYRETLPGGRSYFVLDQVTSPGDDTDPVIVPQGDYFVMGDNRDDSLDSRFPVSAGGVGLLPAEDLVGRALVTFFSTDGSANYLLPWTWFSAARWDRIGATY